MNLRLTHFAVLGFLSGMLVQCTSPQNESTQDSPQDSAQDSLVQFVNPLIGTTKMGHTYPGATVPYGMVQVTPQTHFEPFFDADSQYNPETYAYCAGYQYADSTILGFVHTAFSGTGHSDLGDLLMMPTVGRPDLSSDSIGGPKFGSPYSHNNEDADAGFYAVQLDKHDILAELTATDRCAIHRYTYQQAGDAHLALDLNYNIYHHPEKNVWSFVRVENDSTVVGYRQTSGWGRTRLVHFAIRFDQPILNFGQHRETPMAYNGFYRRFNELEQFPEMAGKNLRLWFDFGPTESGSQIGFRVALSSVSMAGALANLETEAPHSATSNFAAYKQAAQSQWNEALNICRINPLKEEDKITFYTALYHTMLAPILYEDVDGRYRGLDQNIHVSDGFVNHSIFSLWDTYRALHPWMNLTQPERATDAINSMMAHADQSVHGMLPIWSHYANENWCMIGYHAVSVMADAVQHNIGGWDRRRALEIANKTATTPYFDGLGAYLNYGYVPDDLSHSSVSKTLEYAFDDWCIAKLADAIDSSEIAETYLLRSQSYRLVWDPGIQFMRPRLADGNFREDFDPMETHGQGFIEGNAWNYGLYVPHAQDSLIAWHGGPQAFERHLDSLFTMELDDRFFAHTEDISRDGIIGNYVHGNEPGHHIAYLYNRANAPQKTQERVRMICETMYGSGVDGLCGNDDAGQMSAWYLFSSLGFYPVAPGSGWYELGSPNVESAQLNVGKGKTLKIETVGNSLHKSKVNAVYWNNQIIPDWRIEASKLAEGGTLLFEFE
ncbi:MAG: GH92 family glycosyl hydrolase [Bacteroidetes bacterium]|nr:GH92 family glycosyl hydrolase [Bacteroidota bacterium]